MNLRIFLIIPLGIVVAIVYFHWLYFGIMNCNSVFDWSFYIVISIVVISLVIKFIQMFLEKLFRNDDLEYSPTPHLEVQNFDARGATERKSTYNQTESRGFDWSKQKQGSPEAANAYKQSDEHKDNAEKLRTIDELLASAKKEIII